MEPGTILSIVQLSSSVLKLGSKISQEFFGNNDRVPDKLKRLNGRLQRFYDSVEEIIKEVEGRNASSRLIYPGADAIIETLTECKEFLSQYEAALSTNRTFGGASQRLLLVAGPDSSKIEDFNRRIIDHYTELNHWRTGTIAGDIRDIRTSISTINLASLPSTSTGYTNHVPTMADSSPQPESTGRFTEGSLPELSTTQHTTPSRLNISPVLRANSRNRSLDSIPELPSPIAGEMQSFSPGIRRPYPIRSDSGPVMALLAAGRDSATSLSSVHDSNPDSATQAQIFGPPLSQFQNQGHLVSLHIGPREYKFNTGCYRILDLDGARAIEWANIQSRVKIIHLVPSDLLRIPYTIPDDTRFRVFFLPRNTRHRFEIIEGDTTRNVQDIPRYQFSHKPDREIFQKSIRARDSLEMIRALKVHSAKEKDIAIKIHLKVWRRNDQDGKPTFSFAAHETSQPSHHLEFIIRWFKKTPELKGDNKLVLRVYSRESDLDYGPQSQPEETRRISFGALTRRMSGSSNQTTPPHSRSRTPSINTQPLILYDCKGEEPPGDVRNLGHLEIEFMNSELRRTFINACYEAHRPALEAAARRNSTPSPASQPMPSRPPSWTLAPNQGPHELLGDPVFEMPSPSLTMPHSPEEQLRFNAESLFTPPQRVPEEERESEAAREARTPELG